MIIKYCRDCYNYKTIERNGIVYNYCSCSGVRVYGYFKCGRLNNFIAR